MIKSMFLGRITLRVENDNRMWVRDALVLKLFKRPLFVWLRKEEFRLYLLASGVKVETKDISGGVRVKGLHNRRFEYIVRDIAGMGTDTYQNLRRRDE
tara:strand:- start:52 stop:345 length:294 start_codon:yes stop_codon:yes gene_type:complete